MCGMLAVAGHNWPVFARFRGGKGAATGIGVVLAIGGEVALWVTTIIGVLYLLTHNISFALGVSFFALPALYLHQGQSEAAVTMAVGILTMIALKLSSSIRDLQYASQGRSALFLTYLVRGVPPEKVAERRLLLARPTDPAPEPPGLDSGPGPAGG
jgi:glycerol-3-phosphate acyltransferase PlsY